MRPLLPPNLDRSSSLTVGCYDTLPKTRWPTSGRVSNFGSDLSSTYNGHLVCIHDDTVDRTTNGTGKVAEMTVLGKFVATVGTIGQADIYH